ncbi:nicotinamide riboside transporter PnuC [Dermatophilus congolensis]|uniref:Nicotinamide riboside transporter pnuC n=1 Tax=Dermatophilus congolensis TaxID=1863 RepID=A0A239VI58_9MICO|nr:nicotinamide riboside transporter PnuC [Dermatophilus congolensis]MBO3129032.1 nicotinamide mononucleotide transporter [Dermatophilus congolensis]MBO3132331.1 nicotinamide mononucleotide transporter [Dermatophilus congolensis]MBO3133508.1 nicotinamide mononucleotide transporter [Dermatophilus congolensis]MBO3135742.1 nicotinamide mononucleotide transporter [Dermatophilus congolensis]MBO3137981.1 nicotinamide mononucleotide transporter [Dermatophilus congolensis]
MSDVLQSIYEAQIDVAGYPLYWREIIGNGFGLASAIGGMRRRVWAWPVGIIGNVILFTVFVGAAVGFADGRQPLLGQAFRQVFFVLTSVYGWWMWRRRSAGKAKNAPAIVPRWATTKERATYIAVWITLVVICQQIFATVGAGWPAPRWYYWTDAWIFVGSFIATYAMARGWVDFWLAWVAVDVVGVPLLWHSQYYPSAVLYAVYGAFVIAGFVVWLNAARNEQPTVSARTELETTSNGR